MAMPSIDELRKEHGVLSSKYTLELLLRIKQDGTARFVDLLRVVPNNTTLAKRIRQLEELKLIKATVKLIGKRSCIAYEITPKAERIISKLKP